MSSGRSAYSRGSSKDRSEVSSTKGTKLSPLREEHGPDFEVRLSAERRADWRGPWLRIDPRARELLLRRYFYDWDRETTSTLLIERLDAPTAPARAEPAEAKALLEEVASTFAATVPTWLGPSVYVRNRSA